MAQVVQKQSDLRSGSGAAQGRRARGPAPPGRALPAIYIADYTYEVDYVYEIDFAFDTKASWFDSDYIPDSDAQDTLRQLDLVELLIS